MSSCCSHSCCCGSHKPSTEEQEVKEVFNTWLKAVSTGSPDAVMTLYADDAVLLPTLSGEICNTPEKRLGYFKHFTAKKELRGVIDALNTRVLGDVAVNSGHYTFTFKKDGQLASAPARFTYVYKKTPLGWMIIEHHSSLVPVGH